MAVHNNTIRKKRGRLRGVIVSALSLCVLIALALLLVPGGPGPGIEGIVRLFTGGGAGKLEGEFYFTQGMNSVFAELDGAVLSAGSAGIQVLGSAGEEHFREQVRLNKPAVDAANGRAIVYDVGGNSVRIADSDGILVSLETERPVVAASINEKGWFCVSTQGSDGFKSKVSVYRDNGKEAYYCDIASGYVLDARLNRDNRNLAVLSITDTGGRVSFYSRDSEDVQEIYDHRAGEVILAINWLADGRVLAVTPSAVLIIEKSGECRTVYDFGGRIIGGMCIRGGDFIALYLLDYGVGNEGRLFTLDSGGSVLGELGTFGDNIAMSLCGGTLAVLWDSGVALYDSGLNETRPADSERAYTGVLAVSGGKALATGPRESLILG